VEIRLSRFVLAASLAATLLAVGCGGPSKQEIGVRDAQQACAGTPSSLARSVSAGSAAADVDSVRLSITNVILRAQGVEEPHWTAWRKGLSAVLTSLDDLSKGFRAGQPALVRKAGAQVEAAFAKLDAAAQALGDGVCGARALGGPLLSDDVRRFLAARAQ
jgi:hypothetical protein